MILFQHIPKTGGTSLYKQIQGKLLSIYDDFPMSDNISISENREKKHKILIKSKYELVKLYDTIFGHFIAGDYIFLKEITNVDLICFMRQPTERVISNYCMWKSDWFQNLADNSPEYSFHKTIHPELDLIMSNKMSLVEFSQTEKNKSVYRRYLGTCSIEDYSFIGITERFNESIEIINKRFGTKFIPLKENVTYRDSNILQEIKKYYNEIEKANEQNYHYYNLALKTFWNK